MKIIGILTEDFSVYYDLVKLLKERNFPFISLVFDELIPSSVGAIITTARERERIDFKHVVAVEAIETKSETIDDSDGNTVSSSKITGIERAVNTALHMLRGIDEYNHLVIGIDPGKRPGIAVIADGAITNTHQASSPERVMHYVTQILSTYPSKRVTIRVGHGAPTQRNRIINMLLEIGQRIEIVDETNTSERAEDSDIRAAITIAISQGYLVTHKFEITPTDGELKNIQRMSRLESGGMVTISRELAKRVALGEISLKAAIDLHQKS